MKFLMNDPFKGSSKRLAENELYEIVTKEVMNEEVMAGIWGKAFADTEGDEQKAKALYIKYRVQDLKDRVIVESELGDHGRFRNTNTEEEPYEAPSDPVGDYEDDSETPRSSDHPRFTTVIWGLIKFLIALIIAGVLAATAVALAGTFLDGINVFGVRMRGVAKENAMFYLFLFTFIASVIGLIWAMRSRKKAGE
jgi:hypothetical protein